MHSLWEIPQIFSCSLHDGFGFEAAIEKRLIGMGSCSERQVESAVWSAVGRETRKQMNEMLRMPPTVWQTGSHEGLLILRGWGFLRP